MSNQKMQDNQQPEESKGPNKARDLFKSGMGNFKCDVCEESFFSKKEYDRHSKTAKHKAKRSAKKPVEESKSLPPACPAGSKPCFICKEHIKLENTVAHHIEKHGCIDFKKLPDL